MTSIPTVGNSNLDENMMGEHMLKHQIAHINSTLYINTRKYGCYFFLVSLWAFCKETSSHCYTPNRMYFDKISHINDIIKTIVPCMEYSKPHKDSVTGLSMLFRAGVCIPLDV